MFLHSVKNYATRVEGRLSDVPVSAFIIVSLFRMTGCVKSRDGRVDGRLNARLQREKRCPSFNITVGYLSPFFRD